MFSSGTPAPRDAEHGHPPVVADKSTAPNGRPLTVMTNEPGALVPAEDKLLIFRTLTGIDTVPVVSSSGHVVRTAANIGIYTRVVRHERQAKKMYRIIKVLSSLCLGLQIIMGAAVTALGAAKGSYNGITGLGAVSTVTASIVAYIKGTGQPQKLKETESRWKWIREYIEQRERELCLADCTLDVYREVRIVEEMYRALAEELDTDQKNVGQGQQAGAPPAPSRGLGAGMSGTTVGMRRRSDIMSYDGREALQKPAARPESYDPDGRDVLQHLKSAFRRDSSDGKDASQNVKSTTLPESTATWTCPRCEKSAADYAPSSVDKPPKD